MAIVITGLIMALFSLNDEDFLEQSELKVIISIHFLTPVISMSLPSLLLLAFRVSGLDHVAPISPLLTICRLLVIASYKCSTKGVNVMFFSGISLRLGPMFKEFGNQ